MLSGCATATFYSRGNADNPPLVDNDESSEIALVSAEMEVAESSEGALTGEDASVASGSRQDESALEVAEEVKVEETDSIEEKSFFDYLSGRNVAAGIPYAKELPWVGAPDPSKKAAESLFDRAEALSRLRNKLPSMYHQCPSVPCAAGDEHFYS